MICKREPDCALPALYNRIVRGYLGVTDFDWYEFLSARPELDEVNFWRPSGKSLNLEPGTPFFFKLKAPHNAIAGFGFFARASVIPASLAWEAFGEKNGAATEQEMRIRIERYRDSSPNAHGDYDVGCLMVSEPMFFNETEWIPQPRDWGRQTVSGAGYDLAVGEGKRIWEACLAPTSTPTTEAVIAREVAKFGAPVLVRPRLGQGTFRVAVTDAYARACAITTEHSLPVLEAAHIRPYADDGVHDVRNGLLFRSDVHRLFDRGYVTVTPEYNFEVSARLKADFQNGKTYYALHGKQIRLPAKKSDRPDPELLRWHNENRFRAAS